MYIIACISGLQKHSLPTCTLMTGLNCYHSCPLDSKENDIGRTGYLPLIVCAHNYGKCDRSKWNQENGFVTSDRCLQQTGFTLMSFYSVSYPIGLCCSDVASFPVLSKQNLTVLNCNNSQNKKK